MEIKNCKLPKNCFCRTDCKHYDYCISIFDRETFLGKPNNVCLFTPSPFKPKKRLRGDCIFYSDERTQDGKLTFCAHQNKYGIDNCVGCDGYISNEDPRYVEGLKELIEKLRSEENE